MTFILALDQGTSSSRAIVFDASGQPVGRAQREFTQHFPQPGWVEHDAGEIWQSQIAVAAAAIRDAGLVASDIAAIGIANQRETTVLWERASGRPLQRAIVWQDRRTAALCEALRTAGHEPRFVEKTGLRLDPYFSGSKLKWLLDTLPGARERARRGELAFGTIDTWLAWNLCPGLHVTDPGNASRTLLFNIHQGVWDDELLDLLDIPRALLPEVGSSSEVYARADPRWLGAAIPLSGIAGDQQAAAFGQGCNAPGTAKNTYGTGAFLLLNTGTQPIASGHRLLTTVGWRIGERTDYMLEGSVFMAGAIIQWLRDGLGIITRVDEVEALAASVADSDGVVLVPAFAGLGAPWWASEARATLSGMTRGTTRAHLARAALEAIACQCVDLAQAMEQDAGIRLHELRVDGGAAANDLLMQIQADLLGVTVVRPQCIETTALGAARLAALGVGQPLAEAVDIRSRRFEPAIGSDQREQQLARWHRAVAWTLDWEK
ncbi:MAG: glycerol kinase [Betaproteobacteria bacterium HGW-Betaproteobacteria-11]|nr:MAG: glycerol kinase [Betaproteobacteria bacterium HGW-Betaproteobacteria-11]